MRRGAAILFLLVSLAAGSGAGITWGNRQEMAGYPWVFLRGGQPPRAGETLVELAAAGDTSLARGVGYRQALGGSAGWLRSADLALVNLESAITADGGAEPPAGGIGSGAELPLAPIYLAASPAAVGALARAGVDLAGLANNHAADGGGPGITAVALAQAGILPVGGQQPALRQVKGVRLAFLAFNAVSSPSSGEGTPELAGLQWERAAGLAAVRRARLAADVVIVSMHWGREYERRADPLQAETARALLAAGADLVIGHHPHVVQEVLVWQREDGSGRAAALSLGNFAFDQGQGRTGRGLALRAFFDRQGLRALQLLPLWAGPRPRLAPPGEWLPAVERIALAWETVAFTCQGEICRENGEQTGPDPVLGRLGIFRSGTVDMTGDREPETIQLSSRRVRVYSSGQLAWESPAEWRVLDLALGDPDADGRTDLTLAMEKPDKEGATQSHPFVIGFRGGLYRTLWGGSAVRDPLREVEVSDVNSDGRQELVVLEEARDGSGRALTVWRWHGWGFSLLWRSEYADWQDMEAFEGGIKAQRSR